MLKWHEGRGDVNRPLTRCIALQSRRPHFPVFPFCDLPLYVVSVCLRLQNKRTSNVIHFHTIVHNCSSINSFDISVCRFVLSFQPLWRQLSEEDSKMVTTRKKSTSSECLHIYLPWRHRLYVDCNDWCLHRNWPWLERGGQKTYSRPWWSNGNDDSGEKL